MSRRRVSRLFHHRLRARLRQRGFIGPMAMVLIILIAMTSLVVFTATATTVSTSRKNQDRVMAATVAAGAANDLMFQLNNDTDLDGVGDGAGASGGLTTSEAVAVGQTGLVDIITRWGLTEWGKQRRPGLATGNQWSQWRPYPGLDRASYRWQLVCDDVTPCATGAGPVSLFAAPYRASLRVEGRVGTTVEPVTIPVQGATITGFSTDKSSFKVDETFLWRYPISMLGYGSSEANEKRVSRVGTNPTQPLVARVPGDPGQRPRVAMFGQAALNVTGVGAGGDCSFTVVQYADMADLADNPNPHCTNASLTARSSLNATFDRDIVRRRWAYCLGDMNADGTISGGEVFHRPPALLGVSTLTPTVDTPVCAGAADPGNPNSPALVAAGGSAGTLTIYSNDPVVDVYVSGRIEAGAIRASGAVKAVRIYQAMQNYTFPGLPGGVQVSELGNRVQVYAPYSKCNSPYVGTTPGPIIVADGAALACDVVDVGTTTLGAGAVPVSDTPVSTPEIRTTTRSVVIFNEDAFGGPNAGTGIQDSQ